MKEEEEGSWAFTLAEARRSAEKESHRATMWSNGRNEDASGLFTHNIFNRPT